MSDQIRSESDFSVPFSLRDMLEAGVHFGHQTRLWHPKMAKYLYGQRNRIHIFNLEATFAQYREALLYIRHLASRGGKILFVGAKRQAREIVTEEAQRAGMPYVNQRWLGGMMTNFKTLKASVSQLKSMEQKVAEGGTEGFSKEELRRFNKRLEELNKSLGGIKDMPILPDALFVIDVGFHKIAVTEAAKLGIPVVGVVDSNHNPEGIQYVIPGNDDSGKAIRLYCQGVADAILAGISASREMSEKPIPANKTLRNKDKEAVSEVTSSDNTKNSEVSVSDNSAS